MAEETRREVVDVDELNVRDKLMVRGQEVFADHAELASTPIQSIPVDPTLSQMRDAMFDMQRRVAGIQGVDLLLAPTPPPPHE